MKIIDVIKSEHPTLSFEVFPPKKEISYDAVLSSIRSIAQLKPDYMSVTYRANGETSAYTVQSAMEIMKAGVTPIAHLTCVAAKKADIEDKIFRMREAGIENILALRGDIPEGAPDRSEWDFKHASELTEFIREHGDFCIGGACYPEGHPESQSLDQDAENIKRKVEAGASYLTTQMFFDNDLFFRYMYLLQKHGINVPVIPGIMPITKAAQVSRSIDLSGSYMPKRFIRLVDKYGDNAATMRQAGIAYTTEQIIDLYAAGVSHIHLYTMNDPTIAEEIQNNVSSIIGK